MAKVFFGIGSPRRQRPITPALPLIAKARRALTRAETHEDHFRNHPEGKFRLMVRPSPVYRDCFTFRVSTRDPEVFTGDSGDWRYYDRKRYATPRAFMIAECERLLAHPHRCSNPERWRAGQGR